MRKVITESQLRRMVKESVKKVLRESGDYINKEKLHQTIVPLLIEVCDTYDFDEQEATILKDDYVEEYA